MLKSGCGSFRLKSVKNRLTSFTDKYGRLGHESEWEMSHCRSLRSIHFIWFLTTWLMLENSSKWIFVLISMLSRVKNSHYSIWTMFLMEILIMILDSSLMCLSKCTDQKIICYHLHTRKSYNDLVHVGLQDLWSTVDTKKHPSDQIGLQK